MEQESAKPKLGRPATGKHPLRSFRMADDEWETIKEAAATLGEPASAYLRRVALKDAARVLKTQ